MIHTGGASPHASYPSQIPKPLMGSRLQGATPKRGGAIRKRGAPPGSLPTTSSSGTSSEGRDPRAGASSGASIPRGLSAGGFSLSPPAAGFPLSREPTAGPQL